MYPDPFVVPRCMVLFDYNQLLRKGNLTLRVWVWHNVGPSLVFPPPLNSRGWILPSIMAYMILIGRSLDRFNRDPYEFKRDELI